MKAKRSIMTDAQWDRHILLCRDLDRMMDEAERHYGEGAPILLLVDTLGEIVAMLGIELLMGRIRL